MLSTEGFRLPRLLLPGPGIDLLRWAVVACDQYTAEPEYWQRAAATVGDAPSTLHLIFPEAYLGRGDDAARVPAIRAAMDEVLARGQLVEHEGLVLVERHLSRGRVRRGLMLELDLDRYDYAADSTSLIRPTEGTIVARLAPRIAVRRDAPIELPHVLVLIDDAERTVIEPLAADRAALAPLYDTELMEGGGHLAGFAVDPVRTAKAVAALQALADPEACAQRYGAPPGTPPLLFAVGDGNHSLATAKAIWEQSKAQLGPDHPSRWALVEVVNLHDPALEFEPIHRLLFGVQGDAASALRATFGDRVRMTSMPDASTMRHALEVLPAPRQAVGLVEPGARFAVAEIADPPSALAVGTFQPWIDGLVESGLASEVDYLHGDDVLERLAQVTGRLGVHFAPLAKSGLLRHVVHAGPLPRKAFSMGEAHEKRFYLEARRIR